MEGDVDELSEVEGEEQVVGRQRQRQVSYMKQNQKCEIVSRKRCGMAWSAGLVCYTVGKVGLQTGRVDMNDGWGLGPEKGGRCFGFRIRQSKRLYQVGPLRPRR